MRSLLLVLALGAIACRSTPAGPAWPRSAGVDHDDDDEDGGQSLAPQRTADPAAAAIEVADDPTAWAPTAVDEPALPDVEVPAPDAFDDGDEMIEIEPETIIIDDSGDDDDGP